MWMGMFPIILALLALAVLLWLIFTPSGKIVLAQMRSKDEENKAIVQQARKALSENANANDLTDSDKERLNVALKDLKKTHAYWKGRLTLAAQIDLEIMQVAPLVLKEISSQEGLHDILFELLILSSIPSQKIYELALYALEMHPEESKAKQNALKIGRFHFGKVRGGKVSIYDEQAIQNDIQVRSR